MDNLWPALEEEEFDGPVSILVEQGKHLEKMTKGVLSFDIDTHTVDSRDYPSGTEFRVNFYIKAPLLGGYKFLLFSMYNDFVITYPISIRYHKHNDLWNAESEEEYIKGIKKILSKDTTKTIIQSLYSKSKYNRSA